VDTSKTGFIIGMVVLVIAFVLFVVTLLCWYLWLCYTSELEMQLSENLNCRNSTDNISKPKTSSAMMNKKGTTARGSSGKIVSSPKVNTPRYGASQQSRRPS